MCRKNINLLSCCLLFFAVCSLHAVDLHFAPISIALPNGWLYENYDAEITFAAKDTVPTLNTGSTANPEYYHNIIISKERLNQFSVSSFSNDGIAHIREQQEQYFEGLKKGKSEYRTYNRIKGVYLQTEFIMRGIRVGNNQFSFLVGDVLYSIVLGTLAREVYEKEAFFVDILKTLELRR